MPLARSIALLHPSIRQEIATYPALSCCWKFQSHKGAIRRCIFTALIGFRRRHQRPALNSGLNRKSLPRVQPRHPQLRSTSSSCRTAPASTGSIRQIKSPAAARFESIALPRFGVRYRREVTRHPRNWTRLSTGFWTNSPDHRCDNGRLDRICVLGVIHDPRGGSARAAGCRSRHVQIAPRGRDVHTPSENRPCLHLPNPFNR